MMNENNKDPLKDVLCKLQQLLPTDRFLPLHEPLFAGNENKYVRECIDTGWVSSVGKFVDRFERNLADFTGTRRTVAVANGTSALHICLILAGVKPGDEVLVPALTFVATANSVKYCQAIPHFVDSCYETLGMDPEKLDIYLSKISTYRDGHCYNKKTDRRISAVVPMHTFGHPVDMEAICAIAKKYHIVVIEDCAESIGSYYKNRHTGNFGLVSAMSFNGNKTITTGGGGAILTNDEKLGALAKHLTTQAKVPHRWEFRHDMIGYNYRMPNLNAALGCAQLEEIGDFLIRKRHLAKKYEDAFENDDVVDFFKEPEHSRSNYWFNALLLKPEYASLRDDLLEILNNNNIMSRPIWNLMYTLPMYEDCPRMDCRTAEDIGNRLVNIPSSVILGG